MQSSFLTYKVIMGIELILNVCSAAMTQRNLSTNTTRLVRRLNQWLAPDHDDLTACLGMSLMLEWFGAVFQKLLWWLGDVYIRKLVWWRLMGHYISLFWLSSGGFSVR